MKRSFNPATGNYVFSVIRKMLVLILVLFSHFAYAMKSPQDILVDSIESDLQSFFKERLKYQEEKISIALLPLEDATGVYDKDSQIITQLLVGRFTLNPIFSIMQLSSVEKTFAELYPAKKVDGLSQSELIALGASLHKQYLISGGFFRSDSVAYLQLFLRDLSNGILIYAPMFRVPAHELGEGKTETEVVNPETAKETMRHEKVEGSVVLFEGDMPGYPVVDFALFDLGKGQKAVAFITTESFAVHRIDPDNRLTRIWTSEYKTPFPLRGLAGHLDIRQNGDAINAVVSINKFKHSFLYKWEGEEFKIETNIDGFVVNRRDDHWLVSRYGNGVISYSGKNTFIRDGMSDEGKEQYPFQLPVDYYAGCILFYDTVNPDLTKVGVVDEGGVIHIYGAKGQEKVKATGVYGSGFDCLESQEVLYFAATADAADTDSVILLSYHDGGINEVWRSRAMRGAVYDVKSFDLDEDGVSEIFGVLEQGDGGGKFFVVHPVFPY
ncbi:MAG: hypothetical protein AB1546_07485 [bacterium]